MIFGPRHDKTNKTSVRPAKTQISLGIRRVWSESSRMPRLIWVFAGRTLILLVLSCHGSFYFDRTIMSYRESRRFTETTLGFRDYGSARCAATWQNQQSDCAPSEDSDQPGHPPSLIRAFAVCMKKAWILSYPLSAQRWLWSDCADAQADLSLR